MMNHFNVHHDFMAKALSTAEEASAEVPVGAVIVRDGTIIAAAHNQRETEDYDPFGHAEILAMRAAAKALKRRRLNDCVMYVSLEPCPMCAGAMMLAELGTCYFAAFDPAQGCCGSVYDLTQDDAFPHRVPTAGGLMQTEAEQQIRAFFANKRAPASDETGAKK